jgi:uncharacterized protein (TIGR00290 family)
VSEPILLAWSGGKDSVLSLQALRQSVEYDVIALLSNFTEDDDRLIMHRVPRPLIEIQARIVGIPLYRVLLPSTPSNDVYEARMGAALEHFQAQGVNAVAHGDLFLEDIRQYRENNLARIGMKGIYPLWRQDTRDLAHRFIADGFKAIVVCVDTARLDASFAGRIIDHDFLRDLPPKIDPCGENGEFHSFVYDAPFFSASIPFTLGEQTLRYERFLYQEICS